MEEPFYYIDSDYGVKLASHAADEAASSALEILRHNPNGSVETMGGIFTYRMRGDYPVLKFRDEYTIAYFCQDTETLKNLILAFHDGVEDDFFVNPSVRPSAGRSKRTKKSKRSKRSRKSKRARRTRRKN